MDKYEHAPSDEETYLRMRIDELHRAYVKAVQPYYERLAHIESLRRPSYVMSAEDAEALLRAVKEGRA